MYHSISSSLMSLKLMGVMYHSMLSTEYPLILKSPVTCFLGESHKSSDQKVISTCYWVHSACLSFHGLISIYYSAVAMYHAPSDPSGIGGMHHEHIQSQLSGQHSPAHRDCIFVNTNPELNGMHSLDSVCVMLFFCLQSSRSTLPIHWFSCVGNEADEDTGMW